MSNNIKHQDSEKMKLKVNVKVSYVKNGPLADRVLVRTRLRVSAPQFNIESRDNIFGIWETMFNRPSLCPHS
jgi:hypothetical protein